MSAPSKSAAPTVLAWSPVFHLLRNLFILCFVLFVTLEIFLRVVVRVNSTTYELFGKGLPVPPYLLVRKINTYGPEGDSNVIYDPAAGYTLRPNWINPRGLYYHNAEGIRTESISTEYTLLPAPDVLRIAILGDSFTYGAGVTYEDSWGYLLQQELQNRGINAEVINFGVSGYNLAQTLRHYEAFAARYHADIVLLGFRDQFIERSNQMIPALEEQSAELFTNPRYILQDGELVLINNPALTPEEVLEILRNPESNPLKNYEPQMKNLLYNSRLLTLLMSAQDEDSTWMRRLDTDEAKVTLAIIDTFAEEVQAQGAHFGIIHMITGESQQNYLAQGDALPSADFIAELDRRYDLIELQPLFSGAYSDEDWINFHYTRTAGLRIVPVIANDIELCIESPNCSLPRYKD